MQEEEQRQQISRWEMRASRVFKEKYSRFYFLLTINSFFLALLTASTVLMALPQCGWKRICGFHMIVRVNTARVFYNFVCHFVSVGVVGVGQYHRRPTSTQEKNK